MKLLYFSAGSVTSTTWPTCHSRLWLATTTAPRRGSAARGCSGGYQAEAGASPRGEETAMDCNIAWNFFGNQLSCRKPFITADFCPSQYLGQETCPDIFSMVSIRDFRIKVLPNHE